MNDQRANPTTMLRAVIHNPVAGRRKRRLLDAVMRRLAAEGVPVSLRTTARRGDAERLARAAVAEGATRIVVAGGDGTINEALNGIDRCLVPVAIVPLGTANVLAAEIGLSGDGASVAHTIVQDVQRLVPLGRVNGRRFMLMTGIGFDADVVAHVSPAFKRALGRAAYVMEAARALGRVHPRSYSVDIDGVAYQASSLIVAKGHFYGGRFVVAPRARIDIPRLHVALFERGGRWDVLRYAEALGRGALHRAQGVRIVEAASVRVVGPIDEPVQADGDIVARLPATIVLEPDAARLVVPATSPILA